MAPPLLVYVPSANAIKAPNTPATPIVINANNVAFPEVIPSKFKDQGLEDFVNFLSSHSLRYALGDFADPFYPQHVIEFCYTCSFDESTQSITGTIVDSRFHVSISVQVVRQALRLLELPEYYATPSESQCKEVLAIIGYDSALQGTRDVSRFTLRQCLPAGWKYLSGVIGKCLGNKTSSLDKLNLFEMRILFAVVKNKSLDFAHLIFDQFVEIIGGNKRPTYVPYPRWYSLILKHIGSGYDGLADDYMLD